MKKVGFVGYRGMVGSVLLERMQAEQDFVRLHSRGIEPVFFSTSQPGQPGPDVGLRPMLLQDARDLEALAAMDVIVSCQGGALYDRSSSTTAYYRLAGLLDRCCLNTAHE